MHAAAMKPTYLSYKELDPEFIEKETVALKADIEKANEELVRMKKPLKKVPLFGSMLQLTDEVMKEARANIEAELKAQKKPEKIWDKIIPGQIARFIADNTQLDQQFTLLSQFYVMDDKKTVEQVIEEKSKELGGKIELVDYVRFELGEGLEKKGCDFASEVAEQLK
jgi:elongation factor Ts